MLHRPLTFPLAGGPCLSARPAAFGLIDWHERPPAAPFSSGFDVGRARDWRRGAWLPLRYCKVPPSARPPLAEPTRAVGFRTAGPPPARASDIPGGGIRFGSDEPAPPEIWVSRTTGRHGVERRTRRCAPGEFGLRDLERTV